MAAFKAILTTGAVMMSANCAAARDMLNVRHHDLDGGLIEHGGFYDVFGAYGSVDSTDVFGFMDGEHADDVNSMADMILTEYADDSSVVAGSAAGATGIPKQGMDNMDLVGEPVPDADGYGDATTAKVSSVTLAPGSAAVAGVAVVMAGVAVLAYNKRRILSGAAVAAGTSGGV